MPREFADPYLYPDTDVLRNKPGLRDGEVLRQFEYEQSAARAAELQANPLAGQFELPHLQAIHRHLFQDVYPWAGELRTVNIAKESQLFAPPAFIQSYTRKLAADLAREQHLQGLARPLFIERLAHHYIEFNAVHPFREGNGRALRVMFDQLARQAGYGIDQSRIDNEKGQWNRASAAGQAGDIGPIQQMIQRAVVLRQGD